MTSFTRLIVAFLALVSYRGVAAWPVFQNTSTAREGQNRYSVAAASYTLPRLVVYFQTTHDSATGEPISMLPLITEKGIALTHLIVCSFHIGQPATATTAATPLHLNDYPPSDARFTTLWQEAAMLQAAGVRVMGMVGGAAAGSFTTSTLDSTDEDLYEAAYGQLHDAIAAYGLQGMDLDVEQSMSQAGITRLVQRLKSDFGPAFEVTLAPVASALRPDGAGANLSGFSYATLATATASTDSAGDGISFYNAQFYNGFGSLATPADYEAIVSPTESLWTTDQVLLGEITAPSEGSGYIAPGTLNATVVALRDFYGPDKPLGGIMGWEYFDSAPGGTSAPWQWAQDMTAILRPGLTPALSVTVHDAKRLKVAYEASAVANGGRISAAAASSINYMALVNA
ncbi:MAG: hypothetical protein STHCBS139747_000875 [Sporothrix thermara]